MKDKWHLICEINFFFFTHLCKQRAVDSTWFGIKSVKGQYMNRSIFQMFKYMNGSVFFKGHIGSHTRTTITPQVSAIYEQWKASSLAFSVFSIFYNINWFFKRTMEALLILRLCESNFFSLRVAPNESISLLRSVSVLLKVAEYFSDSANPLYNATRYNDTIIYNDKLTGTKLSHKRWQFFRNYARAL